VNFSIDVLVSLTFCLFVKIKARESKISEQSGRNLRRAFGAEGRVKDLSSQIRSLKYQLNKIS
jgi:hypothetical protein